MTIENIQSRRDFLTLSGKLLALLPFYPLLAKDLKRLNVSLFSKHLQWLDFEDMVKAVAEMGYDGIDLAVRPGGHIEPSDVKTQLPQLVDLGNKHGAPVNMLTTSIQSLDEKYTEDILRTMAATGVKKYRLGWFKYNDTDSVIDQLDAKIKLLTGVEKLNRELGLCGMYQNHAGTSVGSPLWDIWYMLKNFDADYIGCQFDIRHAVVENTNSWKVAFKLLKPYIRSVVVKDFQFENHHQAVKLKNVPLGQGVVDLRAFFELIKESNIKVPVSMHCEYPLGGAEKGKRQISISGDEVKNAIKNDLEYLRKINAL